MSIVKDGVSSVSRLVVAVLFFCSRMVWSAASSPNAACQFIQLHLDAKHPTESPSGRLKFSYDPTGEIPALYISDPKTGQKCASPSDIRHGLYISSDEHRLLVVWEEGPGTDAYLVDLVNTDTCKHMNQWQGYSPKVVSGQLRTAPGCEGPSKDSTNNLNTCLAGQIFDIQSDCSLRYNAEKSRQWTQRELGVAFEGVCSIVNFRTPQAKIDSCIPRVPDR